jgi:branched-subunit amino acid aminotransferase/4-amino-4-deoxychorismate lyase
VPAVRRDVGLAAATAMRAAFATNAATGVRPVVALDTARFASSDPVLDRLAGLYAAIPAAPL